MSELYNCSGLPIWRLFLGTEYEHALQFIIEARVRLPGAYSEWLGLQDSFNDIVIRQLFKFLKNKGMKGYSKLQNKHGRMVKYGQLIVKGGPFDTSYPVAANAFRTIHDRRNKLPGSHPYDEKGGSKNKWLSKKEVRSLVPHARKGLNIISKIVDRNK